MPETHLPEPGRPCDGEHEPSDNRPAAVSATESTVELLSDPVAPRSIRPHLIRSGIFLLAFGAFFAGWALGLTLAVLGATGLVNAGTVGVPPGAESLLSSVSIAGMLGVGLVWFLSLFLPVREYIAESGVVVERKAGALAATHEFVRDALSNRGGQLSVESITLDGSPALSLSDGAQRGVFLVRAIGPDLVLGWAMWRYRSTFRLLAQIFVDMLDWSGESDSKLTHASSSIAMRALLRGATSDGVRVATMADSATTNSERAP